MKLRTQQKGFSAVELVVIVVVVGILGFAAYGVYSRQSDKNTASSGTTQQAKDESVTASDVKAAPEIKSASDLDKASAVLDQTDPSTSNNSDSDKLDSQLSAF